MKAKTIAYWITTVLISAMMSLSAFMSLSKNPEAIAGTKHMGYPEYFMGILGTAYALGVLALLAPGFARLKEWAYAGFTFAMISAVWSHIAVGEASKSLPAVVTLGLLVVSYMFRPEGRRIRTVEAV